MSNRISFSGRTVGVLIFVLLFPISSLLLPHLVSAFYLNLGIMELNKALFQGIESSSQRLETVNSESHGLSVKPIPAPPHLDAAEKHFKQAISWKSSIPQAYRNLGYVYLVQSNNVTAIKMLSRSSQLYQGDRITHLLLGNAYEAIGNREEAVEEWRKAGAAAFFAQRGQAYLEDNLLERALTEFERAVSIAPDVAGVYGVYRGLGEIHLRLGRWNQAIENYQRAIGFTPGDVVSLIRLGIASYNAKHDLEEARRFFRRALEYDPDNYWSALTLGDFYSSIQLLDEAILWYERASSLTNTQNPLPDINLGICYALRGDPLRAIGFLTSGIQMDPTGPHSALAYFWRGKAYAQLDKLEEAIKEFKEAVRLEPTNVSYRLSLADAYRDSGWPNKAISEYEQVLNIDRNNRYAEQELDKLGSKR